MNKKFWSLLSCVYLYFFSLLKLNRFVAWLWWTLPDKTYLSQNMTDCIRLEEVELLLEPLGMNSVSLKPGHDEKLLVW